MLVQVRLWQELLKNSAAPVRAGVRERDSAPYGPPTVGEPLALKGLVGFLVSNSCCPELGDRSSARVRFTWVWALAPPLTADLSLGHCFTSRTLHDCICIGGLCRTCLCGCEIFEGTEHKETLLTEPRAAREHYCYRTVGIDSLEENAGAPSVCKHLPTWTRGTVSSYERVLGISGDSMSEYS